MADVRPGPGSLYQPSHCPYPVNLICRSPGGNIGPMSGEVDQAEQAAPPAAGLADLDRLLADLQWSYAGGERVTAGAGERYAMPPNEPHFVLVERGLLRLRGLGEIVDLVASDMLFAVRAPRGGELHALADASWISVRLEQDTVSGPVRDMLPERLYLTDFVLHEPHATALLTTMVDHDPNRGNGVVCDRIATLVASMAFQSWLVRGCAPKRWLMHVDDPDLARVVAAIHENPGRAWSVDALAQVALASRSGFAERFRTAVGATPGRYVTYVRMEQAKRLLAHRDATVTQVAARLGYASDDAFSRAFRRHTGVQPSRWRSERRRG